MEESEFIFICSTILSELHTIFIFILLIQSFATKWLAKNSHYSTISNPHGNEHSVCLKGLTRETNFDISTNIFIHLFIIIVIYFCMCVRVCAFLLSCGAAHFTYFLIMHALQGKKNHHYFFLYFLLKVIFHNYLFKALICKIAVFEKYTINWL